MTDFSAIYDARTAELQQALNQAAAERRQLQERIAALDRNIQAIQDSHRENQTMRKRLAAALSATTPTSQP
jgi:prefoldin subunit 5